VALLQNEKPNELCAATSPTGRSNSEPMMGARSSNEEPVQKLHSYLKALEVGEAIQVRRAAIMKRRDQ